MSDNFPVGNNQFVVRVPWLPELLMIRIRQFR